jgi:major membrane immunogen (membrane-anchored lipoprotein)
MKIRTSEKVAASLLSVIVAGSLLTGCGNQARCDELLNLLTYGPWTSEQSDWYDAHCE